MNNTKLIAAAMLASSLSVNGLSNSLNNTVDFESGLVNWSNLGGDIEWTLETDSTPSRNTGPDSGSSSSTYIYFETSSGSANSNGDKAILESDEYSSIQSVTFDYHMYGAEIGSLSVEEWNGSNWLTLWSVSGQQQSSTSQAYNTKTINFTNSMPTKVRFIAQAIGGWAGDIALDNLEIITGPVETQFSNPSFELGNVKFNTSFSQDLDQYVTNPNNHMLTFTSFECPDWLNIDGSILSGIPPQEELGSHTCSIEITSDEVSFSNTAITSALFTLIITDQDEPVILNTESFENSVWSWTNGDEGNSQDLVKIIGQTPSGLTGPSNASDGQYYAFMETSSGSANSLGDYSALISPTFSSLATDLAFDYHMFGENIGSIIVDVYSNGQWLTDFYRLDGQQHTASDSPFLPASISFNNLAVTQLKIRTVAAGGWMGDISIDNIIVKGNEIDLTDTDNDGMPDYWENLYNLDILFDDSNEDIDMDGLTNLDEYLYGTNPLTPSGSFNLLPIATGAADDGGSNQNWELDGTFEMQTSLSKWIIEKYRSFDFTKYLERRVAVEFKLPNMDLSNINSATLTVTMEGKWTDTGSPTLQIFGYEGDGKVDLNDMNPVATKITDLALNNFSDGSILIIDLTDYVRNLSNINNNMGLMFEMFNFVDRVDLQKNFKLEIK